MNKTSKRKNEKNGSSAKSVKGVKQAAVKPMSQKNALKNGVKSETKEERERRLAKREALTIRAFQMAYDNYHKN